MMKLSDKVADIDQKIVMVSDKLNLMFDSQNKLTEIHNKYRLVENIIVMVSDMLVSVVQLHWVQVGPDPAETWLPARELPIWRSSNLPRGSRQVVILSWSLLNITWIVL